MLIFITMTPCQEHIAKLVIREYVKGYLMEGKKPSGGLRKWFKEKWVDISRKTNQVDILHVVHPLEQKREKVVNVPTLNVFLLVEPLVCHLNKRKVR